MLSFDTALYREFITSNYQTDWKALLYFIADTSLLKEAFLALVFFYFFLFTRLWLINFEGTFEKFSDQASLVILATL